MLDPKIAEMISKEFPKASVVVFDEAHNIGMYMVLSIPLWSYYSALRCVFAETLPVCQCALNLSLS